MVLVVYFGEEEDGGGICLVEIGGKDGEIGDGGSVEEGWGDGGCGGGG